MANQYDTNLKLQAIADAIGDTSSSGLIQALEDIADAVAGGGGGGSSTAGLVSDNFSETDTYDLGDYCIHNNTLYVCINAINTPGPWDLSDWQATNAGLELNSLNSALTTIQDTVINQRAYKNEVLYYTFTSSASTQTEFQKDIARQMPALCNAAIFQGTWAGHNFYFGDIRRVGSNYYIFFAVSGSTPTAVAVTL